MILMSYSIITENKNISHKTGYKIPKQNKHTDTQTPTFQRIKNRIKRKIIYLNTAISLITLAILNHVVAKFSFISIPSSILVPLTTATMYFLGKYSEALTKRETFVNYGSA